MKRNTAPIVVLAMLGMLVQKTAMAEPPTDFRKRCMADWLEYHSAVGRNLWAFKCGLIEEDIFDSLMSASPLKYVTFLEDNAPTDEHEPCLDLHPLTDCYVKRSRAEKECKRMVNDALLRQR